MTANAPRAPMAAMSGDSVPMATSRYRRIGRDGAHRADRAPDRAATRDRGDHGDAGDGGTHRVDVGGGVEHEDASERVARQRSEACGKRLAVGWRERSAMDYRVLGPLEVLDGGGTSLKLLATSTVHVHLALSGVAFEERGRCAGGRLARVAPVHRPRE